MWQIYFWYWLPSCECSCLRHADLHLRTIHIYFPNEPITGTSSNRIGSGSTDSTRTGSIDVDSSRISSIGTGSTETSSVNCSLLNNIDYWLENKKYYIRDEWSDHSSTDTLSVKWRKKENEKIKWLCEKD